MTTSEDEMARRVSMAAGAVNVGVIVVMLMATAPGTEASIPVNDLAPPLFMALVLSITSAFSTLLIEVR